MTVVCALRRSRDVDVVRRAWVVRVVRLDPLIGRVGRGPASAVAVGQRGIGLLADPTVIGPIWVPMLTVIVAEVPRLASETVNEHELPGGVPSASTASDEEGPFPVVPPSHQVETYPLHRTQTDVGRVGVRVAVGGDRDVLRERRAGIGVGQRRRGRGQPVLDESVTGIDCPKSGDEMVILQLNGAFTAETSSVSLGLAPPPAQLAEMPEAHPVGSTANVPVVPGALTAIAWAAGVPEVQSKARLVGVTERAELTEAVIVRGCRRSCHRCRLRPARHLLVRA